MNLATIILASITLLVQKYADFDKEEDHKKALSELKRDLNFPRITTYDFIVGERISFKINSSTSHITLFRHKFEKYNFYLNAVGGGTAGSLIAGRLSEKFNVLLLESGGNPVPATANPFLNAYVSTHPAINNIFSSMPQYHFSQEDGGVSIRECV